MEQRKSPARPRALGPGSTLSSTRVVPEAQNREVTDKSKTKDRKKKITISQRLLPGFIFSIVLYIF